jgi:hypothetical protein
MLGYVLAYTIHPPVVYGTEIAVLAVIGLLLLGRATRLLVP